MKKAATSQGYDGHTYVSGHTPVSSDAYVSGYAKVLVDDYCAFEDAVPFEGTYVSGNARVSE